VDWYHVYVLYMQVVGFIKVNSHFIIYPFASPHTIDCCHAYYIKAESTNDT